MSRNARVLRYTAWSFAGVIVAVGLLIALALQPPVLAWIAHRASGGAITLIDARGSVSGPLHIGKIFFTNDKMDVVLDDVALDWQPALLRQHVLRIDRLAVGSITVLQKPAPPEPAQPPQDFSLPIEVDAPSLSLRELRIERESKETKRREAVLTVSDITLSARGGRPWIDATLTRARITNFAAPISLNAALRLQSVAPFALNADTHAEAELAQGSAQAALRVTGTLTQIELAAQVSDLQRRPEPLVTAQVRIEPFAAWPVRTARISTQRIDPAQWQRGLPRAQLEVEIDVTQTGAQSFAGTLKLKNGQPGTWDRGFIPVAAIDAAIAGDPAGRLVLREMNIDLARAGRFRGRGEWNHNALTLDLDTARLNARALHGALTRTALTGMVQLRAAAQTQSVDLQLAEAGRRITAAVTHNAAQTSFRARIEGSAIGAVETEGILSGANQALAARGKLQHFNLSNLGAFPASDLNASFEVNGSLQPKPDATFALAIAPSHLRGYPLAGEARGRLLERRLEGLHVALRAGGNTLSADGTLAADDSRFTWKIDAPNLAQLGKEFSGRIEGQGSVAGKLDALAIDATLEAQHVRAPGALALDAMHVRGRIELARDAPFTLQAKLTRLQLGDKLQFASARIDGSGTSARHMLSLALTGKDLDLSARFSGGYFAGGAQGRGTPPGWRGTIDAFENRGRWNLRLASMAPLTLATDHVRLSDAKFDFNGGRIVVAELDRSDNGLVTRGEIARLPLRPLLQLLPKQTVSVSLLVSGDWEVQARDQLDAKVHLHRDEGDVVVQAESPLPLGLRDLRLALEVRKRRVHAQANVAGALPGTIDAELDTALTRTAGGAWTLPMATPINAALKASVPSLRWLTAFTGNDLVLDGKLEAQLAGRGTIADMAFSGDVQARNLTVVMLEQGVNLHDGALDARLAGRDVVLQQLVFHAGAGTVKASGRASYAPEAPFAGIAWQATKLEVVKRPDRHIIVTGEGQIDLREKRIAAQGKLAVDEGLIQIPETAGVIVSEDVVVLGRAPKPPPEGAALPLALDIAVDLGDKFSLHGKGLDTQLTGTLRVTTTSTGTVQAIGTVRASEGTYRAYGQKLDIDRGVVGFSGRLDNPSLDILALRKGGDVEAGVSIQGTALHPRVKLVSTPEVPDSEKLSWLVLGKGPSESDGSDMAKLQAAARALLEKGAASSLEGQIARTFGVDEISVRRAATPGSPAGSSLTGAVVSLGKRISSKVYVGYEQGLAGAASLVKINYALSRRWTVRLAAGSDNAVDVFYKFTFD